MARSEWRGMPEVIIDPTRTFADEWQVRDIVLTPSETRQTKRACEVLGIKLGHAPTGRTVEICLRQAMNLALQNHAAATDLRLRNHWWSVFVRAKHALGQQQNGAVSVH